MADETVLLGHGSGGTKKNRIIDDVFAATNGSEELAQGNDAALLRIVHCVQARAS